MNMETLVEQMKTCAAFFYQNREQDAYELLNQLLPAINQTLQDIIAESKEREKSVILVLSLFLDAFKSGDNLALADLLEYDIPITIGAK